MNLHATTGGILERSPWIASAVSVAVALVLPGCGSYTPAPPATPPAKTAPADASTSASSPAAAAKTAPAGASTSASSPVAAQGALPPSPGPGSPSSTPAAASSPVRWTSPAGRVNYEWRTFESPQDGFAIDFPGQPRQEDHPKFVERVVRVQFPQRVDMCQVLVQTGPRGDQPDWSPEAFFQRSRPRTQYSPGDLRPLGRLHSLTERQITLSGHPGWEFTYQTDFRPEVPPWLQFRRLHFANGKGYSIYWCCTAESYDEPAVQRFLNSFRLLTPEKKPAKAE